MGNGTSTFNQEFQGDGGHRTLEDLCGCRENADEVVIIMKRKKRARGRNLFEFGGKQRTDILLFLLGTTSQFTNAST